ncbi:MAG: hypothetical protein D8M57_00675 [Candidatus Scalindua sp. AMX11]|nr:MAG: hypothetical protein DWQ00_18305 [Candidatus Scalindua sp.]NOG86109.1 hypothetical protein [Planctomycetota bacterium]RZV98876.1 MAG: hypothetical protein EX341_00225 [Candidatus Scalindua sp. SCAELEC01]TDE66932.1 MAG: hypothetical protein D8M57_00675 [Candidatus Scalindua sp. AMX11]GJQ57739.1 MAG: hypothetical protein SCALA701_05400 [Candidatus Scalindua sp.]
MQKDNTLEDLIKLVKNMGKIFNEENIRVNIDFDPNDGVIIVKSLGEKPEKVNFIINTNNKTVSGIDTSKFWLPDYSKAERANKRIVHFLERSGYTRL